MLLKSVLIIFVFLVKQQDVLRILNVLLVGIAVLNIIVLIPVTPQNVKSVTPAGLRVNLHVRLAKLATLGLVKTIVPHWVIPIIIAMTLKVQKAMELVPAPETAVMIMSAVFTRFV